MHGWLLLGILTTLLLLGGCGAPARQQRSAPPLLGQMPVPAAPPAPAEYDLGYKAYMAGRYQEAVQHLTSAAARMPGSNAVYHFLGASYVQLGQLDNGIAALIRANSFKEDANTYDWLGLAYRRKGDFAESARCYQKALAMAPDNPVLYYGLGVASYWMGWIPECLQAVEMGLQKNASPEARQQLFELQSWVYASRGMYPEVYGLVGQTHQIGAEVAEHAEGLLVQRQMRGFPADAAGLRAGDILTSFNNQTLKGAGTAAIAQILPATPFGSTARVRFLRGGQEYETDVVVGVPANFAALAKAAGGPRVIGPGPGAPGGVQRRNLKLERVAVSPPVMAPGARFDLEVDYTAAGLDGAGVQFEFSILEGGKVLHTEPPVALDTTKSVRQTRVQHLTAAKKPGTYTIRVRLSHRDLVADESVNFTIR